MFILNLNSTLKFIFNLLFFLLITLILFILFKINFPSIVYADSGLSVFEMEG